MALVNVAADDLLAPTLRSLEAANIPAIVIGAGETPTLMDAATRIEWRNSPWLMPVHAGDLLARSAARAYGGACDGFRGSVVYADDDLIDRVGRRASPHFKPDWNPELFRHFDYLTWACMLRASPEDLANCGGADWAAKLVANAISRDGPVAHTRHILHHRRTRPEPREPAMPDSDVILPPVTVIIPTRNRLDLLQTCLSGLERTDYPSLDVIIVDNGSDDPAMLDFLAALPSPGYQVLPVPGPFNFSRLNNRAALEARGQLLCLLNNDIEVIEPSWLQILARQAIRDDVGAVGAQLLYPDGRLQHAGVVLGIGNGAAHAHRCIRPEEEGYFRRHALPQFVSAVTAACLVTRRDRFEAVGGFDEIRFPVAFNDVDLCMRMGQRGWRSLYEPRATLIHHESISRGLDRDPAGAARLAGEISALQRLWNTDSVVDPYHHPELARSSEQFVVRLECPS